MGMSIINGKVFNGDKIVINNGVVYVDGRVVEGSSEEKKIVIEITEGTLSSLVCDSSVTINGNVIGDIDAGGSVTCQNVTGDVDAGGSVRCHVVSGDVDAGGSVRIAKGE